MLIIFFLVIILCSTAFNIFQIIQSNTQTVCNIIHLVCHRIVNALAEQGATAENRQTILLSATINSAVERLAGLALKESREFVDASNDKEQATSADSETLCVPDSLDQWFLAVPPKLRLVVLASFVAAKCEVCQFFQNL